MSNEARIRAYWREEFALIALLLLFFAGIVALSVRLPFDARLFPLVIGSAAIVLVLLVAIEQLRAWQERSALPEGDADAGWARFATALFSAPVFALLFWLLGFVLASLAAMLLMPVLMGYRHRRQIVIVAVLTVAILALIGPALLNVDLPHGLLGEWLIDTLHLRKA